MGLYHYTGFGDRVLSKQDFVTAGVEDQGDVVFVDSNDHTAELSDAAASFLIDQHHDAFEMVDEDGNVLERPQPDAPATAADAMPPETDEAPQDATAEDQATSQATVEPSAPAGDTAAGAAATKASSTRKSKS